MKAKKLYYAVSARGQGLVFTEKPERRADLGLWIGKIEGYYSSVISDLSAEGILHLPRLTYSDEPIELKLTVSLA